MYRCHPQTAKLVELLRSGVIGEVRVIQATFSFHAHFNLDNRLLNNTLGGGGILDVGCYCTSMARLIAGVATGKDFAEPTKVIGSAHIGKASRIDEYAVATLTFPGDIIAQLFSGVQVEGENVVRIFGTEGSILVPSPWTPEPEDGITTIIVKRNGEEKEQELIIECKDGLYTLEADVVAAHIDTCQAPFPAMTWDDTLGNMRTLDQWRAAIGLVYDAERP